MSVVSNNGTSFKLTVTSPAIDVLTDPKLIGMPAKTSSMPTEAQNPLEYNLYLEHKYAKLLKEQEKAQQSKNRQSTATNYVK